MTKTKNTKRALLTSVLSMMLCVAMLIGSTFAWFTDTVTSGKNKIVAGNLDVQLLMKASADGDYKDISDSKDPIFGSGSIAQDNNVETLWEPGKTQVAYLAIKNNGNLALKYKVALDVQNVSKNLYEVMQYDITPDAQYGAVKSWAGNGKSVVPGTQLVSDPNVSLGVGQTHFFALSVHMKEEATNEYMGGEVDFDLTVLATQATAESDSFNNQYDKGAEYDGEISSEESLVAAMKNGGTFKLAKDIALTKTVNIPAGKSIILDMNGATLSSDNDAVILSEGDLTLTGKGKIESTKAIAYAIRCRGGNMTVDSDDISVVGDFGAVNIQNGTNVTLNGGNYMANGISPYTSHAVYVAGESTLIINGGIYASGYSNEGIDTIYNASGTVILNNGTFNASRLGESFFLKDVVAKGGIYQYDPTKWVPEGYSANKNADGTWTVEEGTRYEIQGVTVNLTEKSYNSIQNHSKPGYTDKIYSIELWSKVDLVSALKLINEGVICHNRANDIHPHLIFMADIDFGGDIFTGLDYNIDVDGNGHTLSNVKFVGDGESGKAGFIPYAGNNKVNGLTIKDATAIGTQAGIFGGNAANAHLTDCALAGDITVTYAGNGKYNGVGAVFGVISEGNSTVGVDVTNATITINLDGITYANDKTAETATNLVGVVYGGSYTIPSR